MSYVSEDQELVDRIVAATESNGHSCRIAHQNIAAGTPSWAGAIVETIANSRLVVMLVSVHFVGSNQVLREVTVADDEGTLLFPLRVDETTLSRDLRYIFRLGNV